MKFPTKDQVSDEYYSHFIRGIFDGDGSIYWGGDKPFIDITGTEEFLTGIRDVLVDNGILSNKCSYIYKSHAKSPIIKRIGIGKIDSVKQFYDFIYQGDSKYSLKRKKTKYEQLIKKKEELCKKDSSTTTQTS